MDRVSIVLPKVLHKRGLHRQATAALVVHHAQEWIGTALPAFAGDLQAKRFSDAVLVIHTAHSIAAQECQQVLPLLREYVKKECGVEVENIQLIRA